jgi:CRISPR-associated protein Cmr6
VSVVRQEIIKLAESRRRGNHPALILQRYLVRQSDPEERRKLLDAARVAARTDSLRAVYAEAYRRWERSFAGGRPFRSERLTTAGRLIVGLGSENVLETELRLHHTYGVPIIPGSAMKGLAAHYCDEVWGQRHLGDETPQENKRFRRKRSADEVGGDYHRLIFGTTEDGGVITFHDAWIVPESLDDGVLRLDVMTPHHPKWQTNEAPPTDFDSPVPVSFLSVTGTFDVRLSWSGPADTPPEKAEAWIDRALQILREALAEWGIGGKTSSGYGCLLPAESVAAACPPASSGPTKPKVLPKPGERVEAQLLEERTKKGGWRAMHARSGLSGPLQNSGEVPPDSRPGDVLELIVASATERGIDFRYPTPTEEARARRASSKGQAGPGRAGRRR